MDNKHKITNGNSSPSGVGGIAVIADDFTGAAELAGIGLRYGLPFTISLNLSGFANNAPSGDRGIVVSTDSRSMNKADALFDTGKAVRSLMQSGPQVMYKKTDSVLRGYVVDELRVQMQLQGLERALLLPANPSLGRTIVDGKYYINNIPISETSFAIDPEFAIKDASIERMLRSSKEDGAFVLKHTDQLPNKGIIVGEVSTKEDIQAWLEKMGADCLIAGAGDCFEALLEKLGHQKKAGDALELLEPHLYISGTSFNKSVELIKEIKNSDGPVHYLSPVCMLEQDDVHWYREVASTVMQQQKAVIAIDDNHVQAIGIPALGLRKAMAKTVKKIVEENGVKEILIEGGATAAAILTELNKQEFVPTHELSRGVIRMEADDLLITVKPGSYELSQQIKDLYL